MLDYKLVLPILYVSSEIMQRRLFYSLFTTSYY